MILASPLIKVNIVSLLCCVEIKLVNGCKKDSLGLRSCLLFLNIFSEDGFAAL